MKRLEPEAFYSEFDLLWQNTNHEWFKVEVLQDYSPIDDCPSLTAWKGGQRKRSLELLGEIAEESEWARAVGKRDISKTRIHVVEEPYSTYIGWEIEHYKFINIPMAGEDVSLVNKALTSHLNLPKGDFMIFDETYVFQNHYSKDGDLVGVDFYDQNDDITKYLDLKSQLIPLAKRVEL